MTKVAIVSLVVLLTNSLLMAKVNLLYGVKSGKVTYNTASVGRGVQTTGTKSLIFDNFGAIKLFKKSKIVTVNTLGRHSVKNSHHMTLIREGGDLLCLF